MAALAHRKEIDGLRSFAVLPVMAFHAGFSVLGGGYIGVDIFFVISGFLITGIIAREIEAGSFSILRFYERRARRILPALLFVCAVTSIFAWAWMLPAQFEDYAESLASVPVFLSNVLFWKQNGYFDTASELKPLLHTWSLAVEEQYYILFPPLMMLTARFGGKMLLPLLCVIGAASLAFSEWASIHAASANFYLLPSRAWELMAGGIAALLMRAAEEKGAAHWLNAATLRLGGILAAAGFAMVLAAIFLFEPDTRTPSLIALLPVIGTCMILLFAVEGTWTARLLGWRPFVAVGLVSYSAYLWHQPLLVFQRLKLFHADGWSSAALIAASLLLAWGSYRLIETPMRFRVLRGRGPWPFLRLSAAALCLTFAVGVGLRIKPPPISPVAISGPYLPYGGEGVAWQADNGIPARADRPTIVLFGDSHARHYWHALNRIALARGQRLEFIGEWSCISLPGLASSQGGKPRPACIELTRRLQARLGKGDRVVLVWAQFWYQSLADPDGNIIGKGSAASDSVAGARLLSAMDRFLSDLPKGQKTVLLGGTPGTLHADAPLNGGLLRCQQYDDVVCARSTMRPEGLVSWNRRLRDVAARHGGVRFIDPVDALCGGPTCRLTDGELPLYWDAEHLTTRGAEQVLGLVDQASFD